jgi:hypothetical protein
VGLEKEYCGGCGREVYGFSKRYSESAGKELCIGCAERVDQKYMAENICSICTRAVGDEVKFVLPSKAYGSTNISLHERLICGECYKREYSRSIRASSVRKISELHANAKRSIIAGMMRRRQRHTVTANSTSGR